MSECTHDCSSCESHGSCSEKTDFTVPVNALSKVKHVIGIVSGKGGVGKSLVTGLMASITAKQGFKTAILDADITGPSIPRMFNVDGPIDSDGSFFYPVKSKGGIEIMSANLLLEHSNDPVVWRGPVIAGMVKQFWTDCVWGDVDFMYVDMPRNGRRAAYGFPKPERRRYHRRDKPAGTRVDDCRQSREDGKYDEYPRAWRR